MTTIIKDLMQSQGVTQQQIADKLGIKQSSFGAMVLRGDSMKVTTLNKILTVLGYELKIVPIE